MKLLERFGMVDCKFVSTPMELNFKKLSGSATGPMLAIPTEYRQLVGVLMFLVVNFFRFSMLDATLHFIPISFSNHINKKVKC